jgi:5-formyltetrahydrofolate cyclo-ligase
VDKPEVRRSLLAADIDWPGISPAVADAIFEWMVRRLPGTVASYLAMPDEVDLSGLTERLPGWRWVFPRVEEDRSLTFRDRGVPTEIHPWGMRQPVAGGTSVGLAEIDLLLVPGIAYTASGWRLGRGGGFYDRVLSDRSPSAVAVGVTVAARVLEEIPTEPHDVPVDWLATEAGVTRCAPNS